jgi:plasmid stabilization system protein ParE
MGRTKEEPEKTYPVRVTLNALSSINHIINYIAFFMHEPISAIRVGDDIYRTIDRIEKNPYAFRECEEIPTKSKIYRKAVCLSWLIIYRISPIEVAILDIIHSSRTPRRIKYLRKVK